MGKSEQQDGPDRGYFAGLQFAVRHLPRVFQIMQCAFGLLVRRGELFVRKPSRAVPWPGKTERQHIAIIRRDAHLAAQRAGVPTQIDAIEVAVGLSADPSDEYGVYMTPVFRRRICLEGLRVETVGQVVELVVAAIENWHAQNEQGAASEPAPGANADAADDDSDKSED